MSCLKCGFCCTEYKIILVTKKEAKEKQFKMKKNPEPFESKIHSNMILKTKKVWVSILGKVEEVCYYFDGMTNLCLIHSNKPYACQGFLCARGRADRGIIWV